MSKAAVITHTDFDGIFSGAMLYSAVKNDFDYVNIILSNAQSLNKAFAEVTSVLNPYDEVYVADISLDGLIAEEVLNYMESLKSKKTVLKWIDHHVWDEKIYLKVKEKTDYIFVSTKYKTAAQIISEIVFPGHEYSQKLFRLLYHKPPEKYTKWAHDWFEYLTETVSSRSPSKIKKTILKLADNKPFNFIEKLKMFFSSAKDKDTKTFAMKEHRIEKTRHGKKIVVIDTRNKNLRLVDTVKQVVSFTNADIYVAVLENNRLQIGTYKRHRIDFKKMMKLEKINGLKYHIKGHAYVVAVVFTPGVLSLIKTIITNKLTAETENIINYLKENY